MKRLIKKSDLRPQMIQSKPLYIENDMVFKEMVVTSNGFKNENDWKTYSRWIENANNIDTAAQLVGTSISGLNGVKDQMLDFVSKKIGKQSIDVNSFLEEPVEYSTSATNNSASVIFTQKIITK